MYPSAITLLPPTDALVFAGQDASSKVSPSFLARIPYSPANNSNMNVKDIYRFDCRKVHTAPSFSCFEPSTSILSVRLLHLFRRGCPPGEFPDPVVTDDRKLRKNVMPHARDLAEEKDGKDTRRDAKCASHDASVILVSTG